MAEVGQRLGGGVYRLSALRNGQGRPVCAGDSTGALRGTCRAEEERPARDRRGAQPVSSSSSAARRRSGKLSRARRHKHREESVSLIRAPSVELGSTRFFVGFVHTGGEAVLAHKTALQLAARLQPLLREKLLFCRMTPWTRGATSIHPDALRSPQQLRALCTVIFILAEQGAERPGCERPRRLKLHPDPPAGSRSYSWRSDGASGDAPPLHRSRTAYYDILKVAPSATQSQIKTAYYKQSFIYHPDKNAGSLEATQRFSEISEAYTVLGSISLRRKYDRGILSRSDVQSAGRPSSKEAASRSTGSTQQHQHQHRARRFSQTGGKTMFDFDAFYQAHYGEQLQREKEMRARKQYMEEMQKEKMNKWTQGKMMDVMVTMMMAVAGLIFIHLSKH